MNAFEHAMSVPSSLSARSALLQEWQRIGDSQAWLMERQLRLRMLVLGRFDHDAAALEREIRVGLRSRRKEWSRGVAGLVQEFEFRRGLVSRVECTGHQFAKVESKVFAIAPIQHVRITMPVDVDALLGCSKLEQVASLGMSGCGEFVGDRGAIAIARCERLRELKVLLLDDCLISPEGAEALAASPNLVNVAYVGLSKNSGNVTPWIDEVDGLYYVSRPGLAARLEEKYGRRPWLDKPPATEEAYYNYPPDADELALTP